MSAALVIKEIKSKARPEKVEAAQRFFKTKKGEYGYGDFFLGLSVPQVRAIAKANRGLGSTEIEKLICSKFHEVRLCGLVLLNLQFQATKYPKVKAKIFNLYLRQLKAGHINNWDLIDVTAPIIGQYLIGSKSSLLLLKKLAKSRSLWQRRAAILFTFAYLRAGITKPTITISKILLKDNEDLIHKAVGWALREVGKIDVGLLRKFLNENIRILPRTTLRYAIEKFSISERNKWLNR
jgi:3-methyladenine DNA glycosylase AlkD